VEYKTLRLFNDCSEDNNDDGVIDTFIPDDNYTNLGFEDWSIAQPSEVRKIGADEGISWLLTPN
ncbi:MAG: PilW family protein, partial [Pedosphaera sp.]|nr:PilW family protein [Pedosphaera sp.]